MSAPNYTQKLSAVRACHVARIDRDRFNEHVAAGRYPCAPETIPGRTRYFDPDDMVALWLFRELLDEGYEATKAGAIACSVSRAARQYPGAPAISLVQDYMHPAEYPGEPMPADQIPNPAEWHQVIISGVDIRKVTTYRMDKMRKMIAHATAEELRCID